MDGSRKENDAEHSWHIALMAVVLQEHAPPALDVLRTVTMLLAHDLVEIDCGDTFCYDTAGMVGKHERESAAAERIFGMLPPDQASEMRALWDEFEARETPEARYANALDRLQPMLHNYATDGGAWREHGVTADRVLRRNRIIADGAPALWAYAREMIADAVSRGYLDPGPDFERELAEG
ncbi:MAG: HD domain-containing protein [Armatimonadetes bacterium]|nr:HD domain-containing protein [Armatimonadota bacterium]